ncbi:MAG TPA: hypothetical protein VF803_00695 [Candidatus Paceibacterota bacterium]
MDDWMKNTPEETRKEQTDTMMKDWTAWMNAHQGAILDRGGPLGKTKAVAKNGVTDIRNDLNYYIIVEAGSHDEAAKLFLDNPHLQIPTSSIEVIDIPAMGM